MCTLGQSPAIVPGGFHEASCVQTFRRRATTSKSPGEEGSYGSQDPLYLQSRKGIIALALRHRYHIRPVSHHTTRAGPSRTHTEVCSCIQPKCTGILYWVLGLHVFVWVEKGTFPCFLHASYMVLCTRAKNLYI